MQLPGASTVGYPMEPGILNVKQQSNVAMRQKPKRLPKDMCDEAAGTASRNELPIENSALKIILHRSNIWTARWQIRRSE
jgi:hypothetical protein